MPKDCFLRIEFCILNCRPTLTIHQTYNSEVASFQAFAKINLGLLVLEKRLDGFHNIETVFHRVNLFDEITLNPSNEIHVKSSSAEAPDDERNICFKAARLVREHLGISQGVNISIQKNIPVGAGLGGGSSDAAVVLRNLPAFWGATLGENTLHALALQLGSDVPYFLMQGSAFAQGRGELLEPFRLEIPYTILLCTPGIHVSTAWAYQQVKIQKRKRGYDLRQLLTEGMTKAKILQHIRNDFEPQVFEAYPEVEQTKRTMLECGAVFALMSGSGSSVYGLFATDEDAQRASSAFKLKGYFVSLTDRGFKSD